MKIKKQFLNYNEENKILEAIQKAEKNTSGEICVHIQNKIENIENNNQINFIDIAKKIFFKLKMDKTKERNAILFYISVYQKKFIILGDEGVNKTVPPKFWENIKKKVIQNFKKKQYCNGIIEGILTTGQILKQHFPYQKHDINELPNEISKN